MRAQSFLFVAFSLALSLQTAAVAQPASDPFAWRVENRFRLWANAKTGANAIAPDALLDQLAGPVAADLTYARVRAFLNAQPGLYRNAFWNETTEQYASGYVFPKAYKVQIALRDPTYVGRSCAWSTTVGAFQQSTAPCEQPVHLTLPAAADAAGSEPAVVTATPADAPPLTSAVTVRDRLIAGIGDSFGSGEGNPDKPSNFENLRGGLSAWKPDWGGDRWLGRQAAINGFKPAEWWDSRCHRSFNSQQVTAALKYAAEHPQEAVTFVSYACSGAHVLYGLLVTQSEPPGYQDSPTAARLKYPQVEALIRNLCRPAFNGGSTAVSRGIRTYLTKEIKTDGTLKPVQRDAVMAGCADETARRKVDAVLLSIGGNDIGFAPVIFHGLLPKVGGDPVGEAMLGLLRANFVRTPGAASQYIIDVLPPAYRDLRQRLTEAFPERPQILLSEYPSPTRDERGDLCGPPDENSDGGLDHPHGNRLKSMSGVWPDKNVPPNQRWRAMIDHSDGTSVEQLVVGPLNNAVRNAAAAGGWTYVSGYAPVFAKHGWCAAAAGEAVAFPTWDQPNHRWAIWNPADWDPYAPRARFFRTPNDTALTEMMLTPRQKLGNASWLIAGLFEKRQEGLLYAHAGGFHPTQEAHVYMGLSAASLIRPPGSVAP